MTDQEQQIALCEWMGWKWYRLPTTNAWAKTKTRCLFLPSILEMEGKIPDGYSIADMSERICNDVYLKKEGMVPDTSSLDALYEMEMKLTDKQARQFCCWIAKIIVGDLRPRVEGNHYSVPTRVLISATATQRREALLRTLGLWKD